MKLVKITCKTIPLVLAANVLGNGSECTPTADSLVDQIQVAFSSDKAPECSLDALTAQNVRDLDKEYHVVSMSDEEYQYQLRVSEEKSKTIRQGLVRDTIRSESSRFTVTDTPNEFDNALPTLEGYQSQ